MNLKAKLAAIEERIARLVGSVHGCVTKAEIDLRDALREKVGQQYDPINRRWMPLDQEQRNPTPEEVRAVWEQVPAKMILPSGVSEVSMLAAIRSLALYGDHSATLRYQLGEGRELRVELVVTA